MECKMSHESCHWKNTTSFQYEFQERSGEKVPVRDVPKSQWCGERAAQKAQVCLGADAKAGAGRDEGELVLLLVKLHPSAVFTAAPNSNTNFPQYFILVLPRLGLCL